MPCNYNPATGQVETLYERYTRETAADDELLRKLFKDDFLGYAKTVVAKPDAAMPFWKFESNVAKAFYEWEDLYGVKWDEYAAAAEYERVARRLYGRNNWTGD